MATVPTPAFPWLPWPGRGWPALASQEKAFVFDLERAVTILGDDLPDHSELSRNVYTAVLNALRGGASLNDVRTLAPGLHPAHMLAAYRVLDSRLKESRAAFEQMVAAAEEDAQAEADDSPLLDVVRSNLLIAARVLSTPCERLITSAASGSLPTLRRNFNTALEEVRAASDRAADIERRLESLGELSYQDSRGVELGQALYHPYRPSAYTNPFYMATRVAAIDSSRAKLLLFDVVDDLPDLSDSDLDW